MKFYLSSFKLGNKTEKLKKLCSGEKKIAYIANALDSKKVKSEWLSGHIKEDIQLLKDIGFLVEQLDLRDFFGKQDALQKVLQIFDGVFISGGNVFILRQAMKLSGFDEILKNLQSTNFVYSGYSAAACVLSPHLDAYKIVDNSEDFPYPEMQEALWNGLGFIKYAFLPHYKSQHHETELIDQEIEYCIENKIPFIALKDGEVMIF